MPKDVIEELKMENGEWRMENGEWRIKNGELKSTIFHSPF
jgi:hypothetical protein